MSPLFGVETTARLLYLVIPCSSGSPRVTYALASRDTLSRVFRGYFRSVLRGGAISAYARAVSKAQETYPFEEVPERETSFAYVGPTISHAVERV